MLETKLNPVLLVYSQLTFWKTWAWCYKTNSGRIFWANLLNLLNPKNHCYKPQKTEKISESEVLVAKRRNLRSTNVINNPDVRHRKFLSDPKVFFWQKFGVIKYGKMSVTPKVSSWKSVFVNKVFSFELQTSNCSFKSSEILILFLLQLKKWIKT